MRMAVGWALSRVRVCVVAAACGICDAMRCEDCGCGRMCFDIMERV